MMFATTKHHTLLRLFFVLALSACGQPDYLDTEGNAVNLHDYHGHWLAVNYWAEWCTPCIKEIPELNRLHADTSNNVQVLGINFDEPELQILKQQMQDFKVAFPVIQTKGQEHKLRNLTPQALPTTYLFYPNGELAHTLVGPQTQEEIEALLVEQTDAG